MTPSRCSVCASSHPERAHRHRDGVFYGYTCNGLLLIPASLRNSRIVSNNYSAPPITPFMEAAGVNAHTQGAGIEHRNGLIEQYQGYVRATVRKLINYMGLPNNRFDDFVSAGNLGLVEAASRFDPRSNDSFQNYAFLRIRGAVIDSIREESELKGVAYRRAKALALAHEIRMEAFNRVAEGKPEQKENKSCVDATLDYTAKITLSHRLSFHDCEDAINDSEGGVASPEEAFEKKERAQRIRKLLATLPERERLILENFYFKDMSFTDIANNHAGLSKSWISRLHDKGLELLKVRLLQPRVIATPGTVREGKKPRGRGRPPTIERRLSGAGANKPLRKRGKPRPRTVGGGRIRSRKEPST